MNSVDKISKEALTLLRYAKDTAVANLATANGNGSLQSTLNPSQLREVINLLELSLSQGFQKGLPSFQKIVKNQLQK